MVLTQPYNQRLSSSIVITSITTLSCALVTIHSFWPFLTVPHGTRWDPHRVPSIFFTPQGPRVTFNSSLKVTRAPATNKPRIKPVNCPAGARRVTCRDPPGTRGQILKESTQGTRSGPQQYPGGSLRGPESACRGPGRSPTGALTMPELVPVGALE